MCLSSHRCTLHLCEPILHQHQTLVRRSASASLQDASVSSFLSLFPLLVLGMGLDKDQEGLRWPERSNHLHLAHELFDHGLRNSFHLLGSRKEQQFCHTLDPPPLPLVPSHPTSYQPNSMDEIASK